MSPASRTRPWPRASGGCRGRPRARRRRVDPDRCLAEDLSGTVVLVDCSALQATTPSFVDELVKAVLVDRGGERLVLRGAPERTVELGRRAAQNRGVVDRLETG